MNCIQSALMSRGKQALCITRKGVWLHFVKIDSKELSLCHKLKFYNPYFFAIFGGGNLWYFKIKLFDLTEFWNKKIRAVARTQFLNLLILKLANYSKISKRASAKYIEKTS